MKSRHIGGDALAFLGSIIPDSPEMHRVEKRERFRFALTQAMRDLRKQSGLTQEELAQRLGVAKSWISRLESMNGDHALESVLAYFDALGVGFQVLALLKEGGVLEVSSYLENKE